MEAKKVLPTGSRQKPHHHYPADCKSAAL